MSISIADLRALANEFNFDEMDARRFLGISTKPRGSKSTSTPRATPAPKCTNDSCSSDSSESESSQSPTPAPKKRGRPPKNSTSSSKPESPKDDKKKRGPSGYNLYVADASQRLKKLNPQMKQKDLMKEIGAEWKALSQARQSYWKNEAQKK
jgi:hypothetical protein